MFPDPNPQGYSQTQPWNFPASYPPRVAQQPQNNAQGQNKRSNPYANNYQPQPQFYAPYPNMPSTSYNLTTQTYQQAYNPNMYQQPMLPPPPLHHLLPTPTNPSSSQAPATISPPCPTLFPVQPVPNPKNNRLPQAMKNIDIQPFPTYMTTAIPMNEIQLQSRKTVNKGKLAEPSTSSENHSQNEKQPQKEEESH